MRAHSPRERCPASGGAIREPQLSQLSLAGGASVQTATVPNDHVLRRERHPPNAPKQPPRPSPAATKGPRTEARTKALQATAAKARASRAGKLAPQRARPPAAGAPLPPRRKSEASSRTRAFRRPLPAAPCSEKLEAFKMSGLPTPQANSCATCNYVMRWLTGSRERMLDDFRSLAVSGRFGPPCDSLAHFNAAAGGYAAAPGPAKTSPIYFNRVV